MSGWLDAFVPKPNEAIPGVPTGVRRIKVPTLIIRGGATTRPPAADLA